MAKIIVGVTGSISAYKALDIISGLKASGHEVKVIMTECSKLFVTEMTLATISQNKVASSFNDDIDGVVKHIELAEWGDCILIAPATANTIAKISNGISDNILTACVLAFDQSKHIIIAPAMNTNMLINDITVNNLKKIEDDYGCTVLETREGMLACGRFGFGKLDKPRNIVKFINEEYKEQ